jgi:hypothetical protein
MTGTNDRPARYRVIALLTSMEGVMVDKKTSPKAAKAASKTLRDGRTAKASKTAAGSALSQREKGKTKR